MDIQVPMPAGMEEILYSHEERGIYDYKKLKPVLAKARKELGTLCTTLETREDIMMIGTDITIEDITRGELPEDADDGQRTFLCYSCGGACFNDQTIERRKNSLNFIRENYQNWFRGALRKMKSEPRTLIIRMLVYGYHDSITETVEGCLDPTTGKND